MIRLGLQLVTDFNFIRYGYGLNLRLIRDDAVCDLVTYIVFDFIRFGYELHLRLISDDAVCQQRSISYSTVRTKVPQ